MPGTTHQTKQRTTHIGMLALWGMLAACGAAHAEDRNPAPWRTTPAGEDATTLQAWAFNSGANPATADAAFNPYGAPTAMVSGSFPLTRWKTSDYGHAGVWRFEDALVLSLPGQEGAEQFLQVWLQIAFYADEGQDPQIQVDSEAVDVHVVEKIALDEWYYHGTYLITIEGSPAAASLALRPHDCTLYVDELAVETVCTDEPYVAPRVGDLNGDGVVDMFDIDPFVLALTDPAAYAAAYPDGERNLADCNGDGFVDFFDVEAFAGLLGM